MQILFKTVNRLIKLSFTIDLITFVVQACSLLEVGKPMKNVYIKERGDSSMRIIISINARCTRLL